MPTAQSTLERRVPLAEAASYLGLSKWTLRSWARQRRIASYQIGKNFSFAVSELERVIREGERHAIPRCPIP